ncbi:hypothetical protein KAU11_03845 [Candidatus Babeliales bacterium]|nr:hypothetical protein [Candidatus Babeliales bacterium]
MNVKAKKRRSKKTPLTKKELKHLKDVNATTLDAMRRTFRAHVKMRKENPEIEPCWTCRGIAQKLGFEV